MPDYTAHESAFIDDGAQIGANTRIWHCSHIMSGAIIGENCSLGQNVCVTSKARIGNGVKIQNNVLVCDEVILGDFVFCGPGMTFTNVMNPRAAVSRKHEYKPTVVGEAATLGANSTILCGIEIGAYAFVAAGAVVTRSVKPFSLVMGNPARQTGWMSIQGHKVNLPLTGNGELVQEGYRYLLQNGELSADKE